MPMPMPMHVMLVRGEFATGYFSEIRRFTRTVSARREFRYWREVYRPRWTTWNSVRTVTCLGASALVMFALVWPI